MNTNDFEEFKSYVDKTLESIKKKVTKDEFELIELMAYTINVKQESISKAAEYIKHNATSNYFDKEKNMFRREMDILEMLGETNDN